MSARHRLFLPVVVLFGLSACASTAEPVAAPAPVSATSSSAAPTPAAPSSAAPFPETAEPTESKPTESKPTESKPTESEPTESEPTESKPPAQPGCPSATVLERLAGLPEDWSFPASGVECWKGWATAEPKGPDPGDGIYLFRHQAGTGWKYHSQGSGYHCKEIGINERAPFCQYP